MVLERIQRFISYKKMKVSAFERSIGASNASLVKAFANGKGIGSDKLEKILSLYPEISASWLLTGRGPMIQNSLNSNNFTDDSFIKSHNIEKKGIPLIPIEAMAGFTTIDHRGVRCNDCDYYTVPEFEKLQVEFLIRVSGDSMYPIYNSGDILGCKKIKEMNFFQWGKIYIIDSMQGPLIKRIYENKEQKEHILCVSEDHQIYPPFTLPKDNIRSLSVALGVIKSV